MPQDALPNESATNLRVFRQQISPDRPEQNMNIGIIQVKLKNWSSTTVLPSFTPLAKQTPPPAPLTTRTRRAWPTTEVSETIVGTEQPHQHRRRWNNNVLDGGRGQQQQKRTAQLKDAVPTRDMNIGIIQVKLKNWSSTTVLPSFTPLAKQTPPAPPALTTRTRRAWPTTEVSETIVGTEQPHQHRRRWNNNVLDGGRGQQQQQKRTAQLKDAVPTRGSSGSSSGGGGGWSIDMGQDMDGLFPYLLLALGLALVAFFIILYAILNALLQRKEAQQNEEEMAGQRRRRRTKRSRRQRRGAREAEAEEDEEWMDTEDEEEADEALERERDEQEERNRGFTVLEEDELYPRHSKWGRKKQRPRAGHEVPPPPPPLPARYQRRRSRASATSDPSVLLTSSCHQRAHRSPHRPSRGHPPPPLLPADEFSDVDTESVQSGGRGSAGQRRRADDDDGGGGTDRPPPAAPAAAAATREHGLDRVLGAKRQGRLPLIQNIGTHSVIGSKAM
uniref:Protein kinase domain-containing protein n=1 Tax=Globodera pallida TaxID=36090 RepID=A0A183CC46_GLOPA